MGSRAGLERGLGRCGPRAGAGERRPVRGRRGLRCRSGVREAANGVLRRGVRERQVVRAEAQQVDSRAPGVAAGAARWAPRGSPFFASSLRPGANLRVPKRLAGPARGPGGNPTATPTGSPFAGCLNNKRSDSFWRDLAPLAGPRGGAPPRTPPPSCHPGRPFAWVRTTGDSRVTRRRSKCGKPPRRARNPPPPSPAAVRWRQQRRHNENDPPQEAGREEDARRESRTSGLPSELAAVPVAELVAVHRAHAFQPLKSTL